MARILGEFPRLTIRPRPDAYLRGAQRQRFVPALDELPDPL